MDPSVDAVRQTLVEAGFEIISENGNAIQIRDLESGIAISCVLEDSILFNAVPCMTVETDRITTDNLHTMLDSQNGISTSAFQLYNDNRGKTVITLNNFAKLQQMGEDDKDDILSCIDFLIQDVVEAKETLSELVTRMQRGRAEEFECEELDQFDEDECVENSPVGEDTAEMPMTEVAVGMAVEAANDGAPMDVGVDLGGDCDSGVDCDSSGD